MATVFTPYSDVAFVAAGLAVATFTLFTLTGWEPRSTLTTAVTVIVMAVIGTLAVPSLWRGAQTLKTARESLREPTAAVRLDKCLRVRANQFRVAELARRRIAPRDSFAVASPSFDRPCLQLNLLPRRLVSAFDNPDWTLQSGPFDAALRGRIRRGRDVPETRRDAFQLDPSLVLLRNR